MATNDSLKNQLSNQNKGNMAESKQVTLKSLLGSPVVKSKFEAVLSEKANGFTASVLNLVNGDPNLADAEPMSIITSAMVAATLDLPIDKNLGYAYIVPFRDWKKGNIKVAQFQLGYKGYVQLAQRSGQYKSLNVTEVYEGEMKSWNRLTEEFEFDPEGKASDKVIGYVAYFRLANGFEKTSYWTKQEVEAHRIKFNKAKNKEALSGVWASDYDAMATKTVLKYILSKWGILSIDMQKAVTTDDTVQEIDMDSGEMKDVTPVISEEDFEVSPDIPMDPETGEVIYPETNEEQESLFEGNSIKPK